MANKLSLIYQDSNVVAVNKPAGLASIPGRGETTSVLEELARQLSLPCRGDTDPRLRVVHRLDKDTSGVLAFALNIEAQRYLSHQFQNNTVQKQYLALVVGRPPEEEGEIDAPIMPDRHKPGRMMIHKRGKPARTMWKIERTYKAMTLLRMMPRTGKTHQIRVHLQHIGHPLVVDDVYGIPAGEKGSGLYLSQYKRDYRLGKFKEEKPLISRLTLHAHKLELELPDGRHAEFEAPLPKDFQTTLNMLDKYAR